MSKQCVTHHFACDCREQKFKELKRENAALLEAAESVYDRLHELGCFTDEQETLRAAIDAARLAAVEHELDESRKAERVSRVQLQAEREARK